ncbi:MAG: hypothetical protein E6J88_07485 [Deltaproteobacteria bacterium]|nr:MAG: hypothetical protein E6J88_07485 [Deltaproteobacteria bacterium]
MSFAWLSFPLSLKRHKEIQLQGLRSPRESCERETGVVRIENTVHHGSAGAHSFRKLGPGHAIACHLRQDLVREDLGSPVVLGVGDRAEAEISPTPLFSRREPLALLVV